MSDTLVLLQLEHRTIGRLLALIERQQGRIDSGAGPDLSLLRLIFEYFCGYPDLCHHPKEDLVFRRLQKKDAATAETIGNLLYDHEQLAALTSRVAEIVDRASEAAIFDSRDLSQQLQAFVRQYRRHLEAEEWYFFPTVSTALDAEDWSLIDFQMFDQKDPLYDEGAEGRFIALRKLIWESSEGGSNGGC
ncbi:MAG TPA: hemerythrin domain-containing protein [Candidatus Krumholzibacteria bacterium]|jgi:hemerythrin-like domain-containing protein